MSVKYYRVQSAGKPTVTTAALQTSITNGIKVTKNMYRDTKKTTGVHNSFEPNIIQVNKPGEKVNNYETNKHISQNDIINEMFEGRKSQHRQTFLSRNNIGLGLDLVPRVGSIQETQQPLFNAKFENELKAREDSIAEYKAQMEAERPEGSMTTTHFGNS